MKRFYYSDSIENFLKTPTNQILGLLATNNEFSLEQTQRDAWLEQIKILKINLINFRGNVYFEYSIPRMGKRIDVVLIINSVIFAIEFKVGENQFQSHQMDQVWDYALDLKNFHETSHNHFLAPILIATKAAPTSSIISLTHANDKLFFPIKSNTENLQETIKAVIDFSEGPSINSTEWENGQYQPTPTIIEAAMALYNGHSVTEISRNDAGAINISETSSAISKIIFDSKENSQKSICFVTGVPGAGKTLVGLNIATQHIDKNNDLYSVFLSGNGPLVAILREALARDKVTRQKESGKKITKSSALRDVKMFIQNVHNFRDDCLIDLQKPPLEHVALFDEAQRAWNLEQTVNFMSRKKNIHNFEKSEPDYLISCLDRHQDWAVIVCLVGGGQEINTGEAGISEWINALQKSYPHWNLYISSQIKDSEYGAGKILNQIKNQRNITLIDQLHLSVSLRSFRAEKVSLLIKQVLDSDINQAKSTLNEVNEKYPIFITRDLIKAKEWLKKQARGTERYGIIVSSQAERLRPHAIHVKSPMDPIHWFLDGKDDVRSSYYLEDVATEFDIQGLELDWACVTWDADFRYSGNNWEHWSFSGNKWKHIHKLERQKYLKNAYRVLLTRARQGMIIVVPKGSDEDHTRKHAFYDPTYKYLKSIGFKEI